MNHNKYIDLLLEVEDLTGPILKAKVKDVTVGTKAVYNTKGKTSPFTDDMIQYRGKTIQVRKSNKYPGWYRHINGEYGEMG